MSSTRATFQKSLLNVVRKPSLTKIPDPVDDTCKITSKTSSILDGKPSTSFGNLTPKCLNFVCTSPPNTGFLLSSDSSFNETYFSTTNEPSPVNVDFIYFLNKPQANDEFAVMEKDQNNIEDEDSEDDDEMNLEDTKAKTKKRSKEEDLFSLSEVTIKTPKTYEFAFYPLFIYIYIYITSIISIGTLPLEVPCCSVSEEDLTGIS